MLYIYLVFSVSYPRLYNYSLIIRDFSERAIYFYSTLELVSSFSLVVKLCGYLHEAASSNTAYYSF